MKLIYEMIIKDNTLINIRNNYVLFTFGVDELEPEENNILSILSLKIFGQELVNYSYVFSQSQFKKIYIGNNEDCNIILDDNLLYDFDCTIEYIKEIGWVINDGYNQKHSVKGTKVNFSEETKIFEGISIKWKYLSLSYN